MSEIAIIIPAFNEENYIKRCLLSLEPFFSAKDSVLVVDAGSNDNTINIAQHFPVKILTSTVKARGRTICHGIKYFETLNYTPKLIIIAHADMVFPPQARERLLSHLARFPNAIGGSFGHTIENKSRFLHWIECGNNFRARVLKVSYGDQAQFYRPLQLNNKGGFPNQDQLEDVELALRMKHGGQVLYLDCPVQIPPRHWHKGIIYTTLRNWTIVIKYLIQRRFSRNNSSCSASIDTMPNEYTYKQ